MFWCKDLNVFLNLVNTYSEWVGNIIEGFNIILKQTKDLFNNHKDKVRDLFEKIVNSDQTNELQYESFTKFLNDASVLVSEDRLELIKNEFFGQKNAINKKDFVEKIYNFEYP